MKVFFCIKCVNNFLRPRLKFDKRGVCDACQHNEKKKLINYKEREGEFKKLLSKYRSKKGYHDCIVPTSGGKDSTYVAHQLKFVYKMNPLCVSWAPAIYTDVGLKNLINFSKKYDTLVYIPNRDTHSKLTRIAFEEFGDPLQPWHYGQQGYPIKMAIKHKIPLVIYGENQNVEYGSHGNRKETPFENIDDRYKEQSYRVKRGIDTLIKIGIKKKFFSRDVINKKLFEDYRLPEKNLVKKNQTKIMFFSYFKKWSPQANYFYVKENCNFITGYSRTTGSYSVYSSLDDKIDELYYYLQYLKFGFGRATSEASTDIRDGYINRKEGVSLVNLYDGEFPHEDLDEVLEYLKLDKKSFIKICEKFRNKAIFTKYKNKYELKFKLN